MRILLDECLPHALKRELAAHQVRTVPEMGWAGKGNGELLQLARDEFEVFLTVDRNLSYQQDLSRFAIAVVVLFARSNRLADLTPLMPAVEKALSSVSPGRLIRIAD